MRRPLLLALLLTMPGGAAVPGPQEAPRVQPPTFATRVEAVRVDVLVTEGGRPVRGLPPTDFEVLDNGVPQKVDLASFEQIPLNVILVLDMSDSVKGPRLGHLQSAGKSLLDALEPADQAALVTFSHIVALRQRLTGDVDWLRKALGGLQGAGNTALVDAAFAGIMIGESDVGRALMIVFSDGLDTSSWLTSGAVLRPPGAPTSSPTGSRWARRRRTRSSRN